MPQPARNREQRKADALGRLAEDANAWLATAGPDGPWLVPLDFHWDGSTLLFALGQNGPTSTNIRMNSRVRIALGHTLDVVIIDGTATVLGLDEVSSDRLDAYRAKLDNNPRSWAAVFIMATPERICAWREENEQVDRVIMRSGKWCP